MPTAAATSTAGVHPVANVPARVRRRAVDVSAPAPVAKALPQAIADDIAEFVRLNALANEAGRKVEAQKKLIEQRLRAADLTGEVFEVHTPLGVYDAGINEKTAKVVDIRTLSENVSVADFLRIVKASQADVENVAGKTILAKCLKDEVKPASLSITKHKVVQ
jgi:hypothetical protein